MSATPVFKEEEDDHSILASSPPATPLPEESTTPEKNKPEPESTVEGDKKRRKAPAKGGGPKKPSEEVLQRRREGRIKAAATIAQNLKKTGIGRFEDQNGFTLTSVRTVPLINQKNYFADYLKKDEQVTLIRNWRNEKVNQVSTKDATKSGDKKPLEDDDDDEDDDEDNDNEEGALEKARMGDDTIVFHPGSQVLRIGRATAGSPTPIPMVIAVPNRNKKSGDYAVVPERGVDEDGSVEFSESFDAVKSVVTKDFKARMRYYKRRMMPNSRESAANFNKKQEGEDVPDGYDPNKMDWIEKDDELLEGDYICGKDALRLPINESFQDWRLKFPIVNGGFNQSPEDYLSPQELLGDLHRIVVDALKSIDINTKEETANLKCLFVIPDLYDKIYVETWVDLLFNAVGFGRVGIIQEAVAATFGAGVSCACVVDVGAEKTSISCVDEGMVINDSRVKLDYGGVNITEAFTKLLLQQDFPYKDINLANYNDDWQLADNLKKEFGTFDDADIAVQLYNFYKRKPGERTQKFNFKVYDEVMLAPLGLFYPDLFEISKETRPRYLFPESIDQYTGEPNDPYSKAHENLVTNSSFSDTADETLLIKLVEDKLIFKQANVYAKPRAPRSLTAEEVQIPVTTPLDKAIIESITNAGIATDFSKAQKLYDNLLVVGGGLAKFPGFDLLLNDRISIWRPKYLSSTSLDEILNHVGKEKEKVDTKRKALITEAKEKKIKGEQTLDEVELTEEELAAINKETQLTLDLARTDGISDQGSLVPINVLPAPNEFDPQEVSWKGGSVYSRLKVVNEMWIGQSDWNLLHSRCLYYKSLFNY
ncbi:CIC11C00000003048 [Sungouiella intermedia]|uniref:CIC11C00000003048 n=1 Tax=Sungouiella intermedia TaxID=45354 RepID=A0A1L0B680_9ASCO|nr:CIC11C00000003048 [[Candida] intermedia]